MQLNGRKFLKPGKKKPFTSGLANYGAGLFSMSRSGLNVVSNRRCSKSSSKMKKVHSSFLPERVRPYWNKLPSDVKNCGTVLSFKIRLEAFKKETILNGSVNDSHFWYDSNKVLGKIEGLNYATNKEKHNEYLMCNPHVAKKRFINLYSSGKYVN